MAEWTKIGMDVITGGAAGAADQLCQNQDDKRAEEKQAAGETLSLMTQYGTYLNYIAPLGIVIATGLGALKGDWATRACTVAAQLAGRKVTWHATKRKELPGYAYTGYRRGSEAQSAREREAARLREQARREAEARARAGSQVPPGRQQVSEQLIPVVAGGKGLA